MKKGFTLIEVLAVVVVLSAVFAIVVPKINQSINARNDAEYTELVASIENAAKLYVSDNYLIGTDPTPRYLTMEDLVENNYLPYPIKDPRDNENFNLLAIILVTEDEDGVLEYEFSIDNIFPVVNSITKTSSTPYEPYLKIGDTLTVNIVFNKTIANTPTVTIGGYSATVSGSGTTRTASLVVPSGYAINGYFTVVVSNYEDVNGVIGEPTTYSTNVSPYLAMFNTATPVASSFTIGSGNPTYSKTTGVTLYMSATNALQMCISTSTTCTAWETYATTKTYTLATGDGTKTLYVKFRNSELEEVSANDSIILDATAPTCATSGGSTTWYKTDRTITGTCTDALSGCTTASSTYTYTTNTNTTTAGPGTSGAAWTATDLAGNSSTCLANQTVRIDKTAPTCVNSGGSSTWYKTDRTLTGTCSDTGGSECNPNASKLYNSDINSTTESPGTVSDKAGNSTVCAANQTVKIDKTAPTCATSGGSSTWINTSRTITGTCTDTAHATVNSGCVGNISYTYNPAANTVVNITNGGPGTSGAAGTVSDNAGNTVACAANQIVKIDKVVPPATAHNPTTRAWGNTDISIALSATDANSGTASYQYCTTTNGTTCTPATAGGTVSLTATGQYTVCSRAIDVAGNIGTTTTTCSAANAYKIDKAVPAVATISRSGIYYYTVTAGTDTGSGVQKATYALSGAITVAETTYSTAVTINTVGTTTITSYTYDNANNKSSAATASVIVAAALCSSGSASGTAPNVKCTYAASGGYYYCNSGTVSGSECYTSASGGYYYCTPSSLQLSGDQCYWDADYTSFYCPSGGTLSGGTCYITDTTTASCPSGYTESGSTCSKTTSSTVTQTANRDNVCVCETSGWDCSYSTPSFSTCSGTAGSITYGTCSPTKPSTCNSSIYGIPYSCTASCSRSCTTYSTTTTNPVCPSGYSRSGWTCTRTTSYAASGDYYSCPDGSIKNGTTCHYAAQYESYYCSSGWYVNGSNCYTNADYQDYYCSSGHTLSGTTCSLNRSCSSGYTYAAATDKCYK